MAISETRLLEGPKAVESLSPIPFERGQYFGSIGAPISQETAELFRAGFGRLKGLGELSDVELELAVARETIDGYISGATGYVFHTYLGDGKAMLPIEKRAAINPHLLRVSPDGLDTYRAGYDFRPPAYFATGEIYSKTGEAVHLPDAFKLGFIIRASKLPGGGLRIDESEVPDAETWETFVYGETYLGAKKARDLQLRKTKIAIIRAKGFITAGQLKRIGEVFDLGGRIGNALAKMTPANGLQAQAILNVDPFSAKPHLQETIR
jgi:hypothetical protein